MQAQIEEAAKRCVKIIPPRAGGLAETTANLAGMRGWVRAARNMFGKAIHVWGRQAVPVLPSSLPRHTPSGTHLPQRPNLDDCFVPLIDHRVHLLQRLGGLGVEHGQG